MGSAAAPSTVTVFADVVCPFAHVGLRRLVAARAERGRSDVALHVRAWPLEWVNGTPMGGRAVAAKAADLRAQVAPDLFAHLDPDRFPATSIPALALTEAAYALGPWVGEAVALDLRTELFERGHDVSDPAVLAAVAARHGVTGPGDEATVRRDLEEGRARGVVGSPHFFVGEQSLFCPVLDIHHAGGHLAVAVDAAAYERLVADCFPSPG